MIFTTARGLSIDTEKDLTAPERHIIQKLFFWEDLAESVDQFRNKVEEALKKGWNASGPIPERPLLREIVQELEERVTRRIARGKKTG